MPGLAKSHFEIGCAILCTEPSVVCVSRHGTALLTSHLAKE